MATTLSALLNIRANVQGQGAVGALGNAIGGIKGAAGQATGAIKGLTGAAGLGGLAGAMGALTPLLSVAGLLGLAKSSMDTGAALFDMSQKTGTSVEMLAKFRKAAGMTGTTLDAVGAGLNRLAKAMVAASATDLGGKTKEEIDQAVKAVEDGEKRQTLAIEREADRKMAALDRETDRRLAALNKRYRREEQLLKDTWDDQADATAAAADRQTDALLKAAERSYSARRRALEADKALSESARDAQLAALQDAYDSETNLIRDNAERQRKTRDRAARDQQQAILDQLDERKTAEMEALKAKVEAEKTLIKDGARAQLETIKAATAASVAVIKQDPGESAMADQLDDLGLSGKGASDAFRTLGINVKDANGKLRPTSDVMLDIANKFKAMEEGPQKTALAMKLFGKSGADLIPMLNLGGTEIDKFKVAMSTEFAAAAKKAKLDLTALGGQVGLLGMDIAKLLLPYIKATTEAMLGLMNFINKQNPAIRSLIVTVGTLSIAFVALAPAITALVSLGGVLAGVLGAGGIAGALATLAGWLGAVVPFFSGLAATIAGFISWPVLLVAALVAAGVAIFTFRDQIGAFFNSVGQLIVTLIATIWQMGEPIRQFWANLWQGLQSGAVAYFTWLRNSWTGFASWVGGIFRAIGQLFYRVFVQPIVDAFRLVVDTGKGALRGLLQWAANAINGVIRMINRVIDGINLARRALGQSTFGKLGEVQVPAFAQGGYVTGPTLGLVGEAGNEYVVPEGKAAAFASNYLAGARGQAAIPTGTSRSATGGPTAVTVNLTTGPVLQQPDGTQAVALADVERLVRQGVADTVRQLRTPGGRYALGVR